MKSSLTLSTVHCGSVGLNFSKSTSKDSKVARGDVSDADLHLGGSAATKRRDRPLLARHCTQAAAQPECPAANLQCLHTMPEGQPIFRLPDHILQVTLTLQDAGIVAVSNWQHLPIHRCNDPL